MKINFNPAGVPKAEPTQPVTRSETTESATDGVSFQTTSALTDKLKNQTSVRADKVEYAKSLVSDSKYPPDDVLDRIAVLLATKLKQQ